jgi:hypothetical protein
MLTILSHVITISLALSAGNLDNGQKPEQKSTTIRTQVQSTPILQIVGKKINVSVGGKIETFVSDEDPNEERSENFVAYRRNNRWAVWDDRGLTIRSGKYVTSSKLGDIAVSPRAFTRDQIRSTLDLFDQKKRSKPSDSLSGSVRIGTKCYFLPRWTDSDGHTWLEALIEVDLALEKPKAKFLGRFKGFTSAYKPIDDKLFTISEQISAVTSETETWGVGTYVDDTGIFEFSPLGAGLVSYYRGGYFIERTSYSTYIVGQVDLASGLRKNLYESRNRELEMQDGSPLLVVRNQGMTVVKNLRTGGQVTHQSNAYVASVDKYVLVWTKENRTTAWLYDPTRWTTIATAVN